MGHLDGDADGSDVVGSADGLTSVACHLQKCFDRTNNKGLTSWQHSRSGQSSIWYETIYCKFMSARQGQTTMASLGHFGKSRLI